MFTKNLNIYNRN